MKPSFTSHDLLYGVLLCEMGIKNRTWTWGDGPRLFCGSPVDCCVWVEWHVEGATRQEPAPIVATRKSTKCVPDKLSTPLFLQVRKSNQNLERLFNFVLAKWEQIRMLVYQSNSFQFRVVIYYFIIYRLASFVPDLIGIFLGMCNVGSKFQTTVNTWYIFLKCPLHSMVNYNIKTNTVMW